MATSDFNDWMLTMTDEIGHMKVTKLTEHQAEINLINEALKVCPDVSVVDVVQLIFMRQTELEQEPEEHDS